MLAGGESTAGEHDLGVVAALLARDEAAFLALVRRHHASMIRVAQGYVRSEAVAEEVVQETWVGVLGGLSSFAGRSSLKAWIFGILVNCARARGKREQRSVPFSSLGEPDAAEPAVDPDRFIGDGHRWAGHWAACPASWGDERLLSLEVHAVVERAIEALPSDQRAVITMRDVEGWSAGEVCDALGHSDANQRVLLHRARSRVRRAVEQHLEEKEVVQ